MTEAEAAALVRAHVKQTQTSPFSELAERARRRSVDQVELESDGLHCRRIEIAYDLLDDGSVRLTANLEEAGIPILGEPLVETVTKP